MKNLLFLFMLLLLLGAARQAQGQDYTSAIGLRLGAPISVSYKQFINDQGAIEVFGGLRAFRDYSWFNIAGMYEHHQPIPDVDGLMWYFGGGASAFFWNYDDDFYDLEADNFSIGLLGTIGLDYKFANAPFNISLDWTPILYLNGFLSGFGGGYGALGVRYTLR